MSLDWDADDFEPEEIKKAVPTDKWAGEDEEDDVKDNWDDEDDKPPDQENQEDGTQRAIQVKKKKPLKERIAEKEAARVKELEETRRRAEEERRKGTPEGILEEKLRRQKLQEESDLELAKEALGLSGSSASGGLDSINPKTKDDFDTFAQKLAEKLTQYEHSIHYVGFLEKLFREVTLGVDAEAVKKLGSTLNAVANEKMKAQKAKTKKPKQKAKLNVGHEGGGYDDHIVDDNYLDDFM